MKFWKMSGAGNDFVLLDWTNRKPSQAALAALARALCDRRAGIGADGLLVLAPGPRLLYFNADGSKAFCGNGARCAAWWLYRRGLTRKAKRFQFETAEGPVAARVVGKELVSIAMPRPHSLRLGLKIKALGRTLRVHAVNTGVPHAVVEVGDVDSVPVFELGRALRRHAAFAPAGANVNFIRAKGGKISLRTYERGVEDETLACGTGATASALVAAARGLARSPVRVRVRGGADLTIRFKRDGAGYADVWLEGPAQQIFSGEIDL